jgi:F5/8 type C domain/PQQ-like domain
VRIATPSLRRTVGICLVAIALLNARRAGAVNVLTQHNDTARTGANLNETVLTTANVNSTQFGKLWSYTVNGQVYAQPLVAQGVTIGGVARNVVYVATMHNTVYAFDADSSSSTPLWSVNLGTSVALPSSTLGGGCNPYQDIQGEIGIMSTPVIDLAGATLYVEAKTLESGAYIDRLHALDTTTGAEKMGGPIAIHASVSGTAGARTLDSLRANQRAGLLLSGGRVYVGFASYCDSGSYYGWLLGFSASNLAQAPVVYTPVQDGTQAGIWMSGEGPAADASGNVYVATGNGSFNGNTAGGRNLGNSFVKLSSTLSLLDWFTPYNQSSLNASDLDLGSAGTLLLPGTSLVVGGGKEGKLYVVNANGMGHYQSGSDSQIVQSFMSSGTHLHGSPVYWNGPSGALIYVGAESDYIKGYRLTSGLFATSPFTQTSFTSPRNAMPGSILAVSANGSTQGSGILWANMTISQDANHATVPGVLRAFDASNLSIELWNSQQNSARDSFGNHAKYCAPTIVNGKVFMGTFSKQVVVYGLLTAATATPTATANGRATATATARATATATARPTATVGATATATTAGSTLLSLARPVAVSSTENTGTPGSAAVDGSTTTRWSSAFSDPQWIYVDLGATHTVNRVVLNWEAAYGKAFQIQTSTDAVTWTTIYQTTTGAGGINDVTVSGSGRYVRMYGTVRGTAWGYSLWELEVYGT